MRDELYCVASAVRDHDPFAALRATDETVKLGFGFRQRDTHGENMEYLSGRTKACACHSASWPSPNQSCPVALSVSVFRWAPFSADFSALLAFSFARTEFQ